MRAVAKDNSCDGWDVSGKERAIIRYPAAVDVRTWVSRPCPGDTDGEVHRDMVHPTAGLSRRTAPAALILAVVTTVTSAPLADADAATVPAGEWPGDGIVVTHNGNGKLNKNDFSVNSPSNIRGIQNLSSQNIGGQNLTQHALCKRKFRHCRIVQRLVAVDP